MGYKMEGNGFRKCGGSTNIIRLLTWGVYPRPNEQGGTLTWIGSKMPCSCRPKPLPW